MGGSVLKSLEDDGLYMGRVKKRERERCWTYAEDPVSAGIMSRFHGRIHSVCCMPLTLLKTPLRTLIATLATGTSLIE